MYGKQTAITGDGNKLILLGQQVRQRLDQQFEGLEEYDYLLEARTGWRYYPSSRTTHSSSSSHWQPSSNLWSGLTLLRFFLRAARHPADTDGSPTAGSQVLSKLPNLPWNPYHSGPALHCRVPSRSERCLLSKSDRYFFAVVDFDKSYLLSVELLSCLEQNFSSLIVHRCHFACWKLHLLAIDGRRRRRRKSVGSTPTVHFKKKQLLHRLVLFAVRVYSHTLAPCTCMAQVTKHFVCVSPNKIHTLSSSRNVVHLAEPDTTHGHSFITFS